MPLLYTPDLLFEGFSLSRAVLLDSEGNEQPDGEIYGVRSAVWEPEIESYDEFSHEKLINVWSDVRRVNFTMEAGYTSMSVWSKLLGSSVTSQTLITNLLTANRASAGDTLGAVSGMGGYDSGFTLVTSGGVDGGAFVRVTANTGNGLAYIEMWAGSGTSVLPVSAGETYTISAAVRTSVAGSGRQMSVYGVWWDSAGGYLTEGSVKAVAASTSWTRVQGSVQAPVGAAYLTPRVYGSSLQAGETLSYDSGGVWQGEGGTWAMPGEPILGLTDTPNNWQDSLPLWEHGSGNSQALPVRITFPAKDAEGNMQDLSLTLFKVKFKPPKSSGASYKDGQSVTYEATAMLSATDETGAALEREAFGRIDRAYSVG